MRYADFTSAPFGLFQSAPGREAGRCLMYAMSSPDDMRFQSAPGREAGRCAAIATYCIESEARQACANLFPSASSVCDSRASNQYKLLKNKDLPFARTPKAFVAAWGSRVISTKGLQNQWNEIFRIVSPALQPAR